MEKNFEQYAQEVRRGLEEDWGTFAPFAPFGTGSQPPQTDPDWEEPVPFQEVRTPPFPTESLPHPLDAFVESLAEATQTPEEMAGLLCLGILATAFQSRLTVEVTPDWREPLCLYCAAVAPPGERKTAVMSALTRPLYDYESERQKREAVEVGRNRTERALLEKSLAAAQNAAAMGKGGREEALELAAQLAEFQDRSPFRLLADDTTVEKLVDIMDAQNGCITVCSAEGGVFDAMNGRYDRAASFDVYLKGHAGDPIVVDRIGRRQNRVSAPRLTMLLTIQPQVLSGLMNNAVFKGRGLCGRFLYAMCRSKVGRRKATPEPMDAGVRSAYGAFVRRILDSPYRGVIRLSPEADRLREAYQDYVEGKLRCDWERMRDWGGKLVGAVVRIGALLHAAQTENDPTQTPISQQTMIAAVNIGEFLAAHAEAAYQLMGGDGTYEDARYLWQRLWITGQPRITRRELQKLCKGRFRRMAEMAPALRTLTDMGYIREEELATGGRPTRVVTVNPRAVDSGQLTVSS